MQDLELQLSALKELSGFLLKFKDDLGEIADMYNSKVRNLRDAGLPMQIADNYEANYCTSNLMHLRNLIASITDKDLPYIHANIAQFEEVLARARVVYRSPSEMHYEVKSQSKPAHEPSTLSKMIDGAMSKTEPGVLAQIAGELLTDAPVAGDAIAQLAQMVIGAAPVAAKGFMEAAHRQHAFPAAPLEGVDFIYNENGVPEPIIPMCQTIEKR